MATLYQSAPPVNTPPALRLIQDEQAPPYDGQASPRREPFLMISHEVFKAYAAKAGPTAWAVFTCLLYHADRAGRSFPTHATIGTETGIRKRDTIVAALTKLEALGLIRSNARAGTSNEYFIDCKDVGSLANTLPENRVDPLPENRTPPYPEMGEGVYPKNGHKLEPLNQNHLTKTENTPLPPKGEDRAAKAKPTPKPVREGFDRWYDAYPRHTDRKAAERAWSRLPKDAPDADVLIAAVERQRLVDREWRYIPHPSTWLNGEKWTDEAPKDKQPRSTNGHAPNLTPAERSLRNIDRAFAQIGVPDRQPAGDVIDVNGVER